jgi:hypothetical protein
MCVSCVHARLRVCVCVCLYACMNVYACVCVCEEWQTLVCVDDWSNGGGDGNGATVLVVVCCGGDRALVLGTNQYLTGGKQTQTDGREKGGRPGSRLPSAIPHRLILCCAPVHVFLRLQFQFTFYTVLLQHRVATLSVRFPPRSLVGPDAEPLALACYILHKCRFN